MDPVEFFGMDVVQRQYALNLKKSVNPAESTKPA
jgi:hypothetical protein